MVRALHEAGIEVILDVVYNHTAEGNHLGPDAVASAASTTRPTTGWSTTTAATTWTSPAPATSLNVRHPHVAAADHGLAALLGHRDARRRLPLRPGRHPGPRVPRRRPARRVLRPGPAGPGGQPGQADRRAVGRRRRRLPGRQLPAAVDRVERQVPRHGARLLARRAVAPWASSPPASPARPTCTSTTAGDRSPAINFVTAHDGFTLHDLVSYNDKHNEANGEDNRDGADDNRSWNCGAEGPTDDPEVSELRARQRRNLLATLLLSPGRADDARRRRARPHPARQQQRLLPGQRDLLGRLGAGRGVRRPGRVHRRAVGVPPGPPGVPPPPVLPRPPQPRGRQAPPTSCGSASTAPRWPTRTGPARSAAA